MSGRTLASRNTWVRIKRNWILYAMLMPVILYFVVFKVQSIMGMSLAFYDYRIVGGNVFVGLKHFRDLFSAPMFWQIMKNILIISFVKLIINMGVVLNTGCDQILNFQNDAVLSRIDVIDNICIPYRSGRYPLLLLYGRISL